jgi:membrane-associated protein
VFDSLEDLSDSPLSYLAIFGLVALDAVFPVAPSETLVVTGGVLAGSGGLVLPIVIASAAAGAILGDSVLYVLGRRAAPFIERRLFTSERSRRRLEWAERQLRTRTWLLIASDFVPGGRTAVMFAAGALGVPTRRFYAFVVAGATIWASFYVFAGVAGAEVFGEDSWAALIASLVVALGIGLLAELVFLLRRAGDRGGPGGARRRRTGGQRLPPP